LFGPCRVASALRGRPSTFLQENAMRHGLTVFAFATLAVASAQAHVTLETGQAPAGSYYKAVFRVGHGCDGSPVKQLIVNIPPGVQGAKPMAKPGWRIEIDRAALAKPYTAHGRTVSEDVAQIRFAGGPLPDAHYDEFAISVKLPDDAGPLYWKVSQVCEQGRVDWVEVPQPGQALHDLKAPAALLEVVPAEHAGHAH
jgi:periplasmic copper chaperone A